MNLKQTIEMDFAVHGIPPRVYGKQDDSGSRAVEILLYDQGVAWDVPEGALLQMRYRTAAGPIGVYDAMPGGSTAFAVSGNTITAQLVPQIFALPGTVHCEVRIVSGAIGISTWAFLVEVQEGNVGDAVLPSDYINVLNTLAAQVAADADRAEAAANSIDTSLLMHKAAYDPNGTVAAAGGVPAYVAENAPDGAFVTTITYANGACLADHTYAEIYAAYQAGQLCLCKLAYLYNEYGLISRFAASEIIFSTPPSASCAVKTVTISSANAVSVGSTTYVSTTSLSSAVDSSSTTTAANSYAVKKAYENIEWLKYPKNTVPVSNLNDLITPGVYRIDSNSIANLPPSCPPNAKVIVEELFTGSYKNTVSWRSLAYSSSGEVDMFIEYCRYFQGPWEKTKEVTVPRT